MEFLPPTPEPLLFIYSTQLRPRPPLPVSSRGRWLESGFNGSPFRGCDTRRTGFRFLESTAPRGTFPCENSMTAQWSCNAGTDLLSSRLVLGFHCLLADWFFSTWRTRSLYLFTTSL